MLRKELLISALVLSAVFGLRGDEPKIDFEDAVVGEPIETVFEQPVPEKPAPVIEEAEEVEIIEVTPEVIEELDKDDLAAVEAVAAQIEEETVEEELKEVDFEEIIDGVQDTVLDHMPTFKEKLNLFTAYLKEKFSSGAEKAKEHVAEHKVVYAIGTGVVVVGITGLSIWLGMRKKDGGKKE